MKSSIAIFLLHLLTFSLQSFASVFPDQREVGAKKFIKFTKKGSSYSFKICCLTRTEECQQIGSQSFYTAENLAKKSQAIKDKTILTNIGALATGGLSLLFSARYHLMRKSIEPSALNRDITLSYELSPDGIATGTIEQYADRLESALKTKI